MWFGKWSTLPAKSPDTFEGQWIGQVVHTSGLELSFFLSILVIQGNHHVMLASLLKNSSRTQWVVVYGLVCLVHQGSFCFHQKKIGLKGQGHLKLIKVKGIVVRNAVWTKSVLRSQICKSRYDQCEQYYKEWRPHCQVYGKSLIYCFTYINRSHYDCCLEYYQLTSSKKSANLLMFSTTNVYMMVLTHL